MKSGQVQYSNGLYGPIIECTVNQQMASEKWTKGLSLSPGE